MVKRALDLAIIFLGAPIWVTVLIITYIGVRLRFGSPVFFRQARPGRGAKPFLLIKFRSMTDARDDQGNLLPDEQRLPAFGKWLRASSLDEFPELFNVLKGEMSLVGPRPLLMQYLPLYSQRQAKRHDVKPGMTGWAQINGRNAISWDEKFEMDVWYVENQSFWLDLRILFLTFVRVFARQGINTPGHATAPVFTGSKTLESVPEETIAQHRS